MLYILAWTSISLNAGDDDDFREEMHLGTTVFQPGSCYELSFRDICSEESRQEGEDTRFSNVSKVLRDYQTTPCPGWCAGKTYTNHEGDALFFKDRLVQ